MDKDLKSFFMPALERMRNQVIGSALVSWPFINWRIVIIGLGDTEKYMKDLNFKSFLKYLEAIGYFHGAVLPVIFGVVYVLLINPSLKWCIAAVNAFQAKKTSQMTARIMKEGFICIKYYQKLEADAKLVTQQMKASIESAGQNLAEAESKYVALKEDLEMQLTSSQFANEQLGHSISAANLDNQKLETALKDANAQIKLLKSRLEVSKLQSATRGNTINDYGGFDFSGIWNMHVGDAFNRDKNLVIKIDALQKTATDVDDPRKIVFGFENKFYNASRKTVTVIFQKPLIFQPIFNFAWVEFRVDNGVLTSQKIFGTQSGELLTRIILIRGETVDPAILNRYKHFSSHAHYRSAPEDGNYELRYRF